MECKFQMPGSNPSLNLELIDTLWNVNAYFREHFETILGINRYIMECK